MTLLRQSPIAGTSATKEDLMATRICPSVVRERGTARLRVEDEHVLLRCTRVERLHKSTLSGFRYTIHLETRYDTELSITINGRSCSHLCTHQAVHSNHRENFKLVNQLIDLSAWLAGPLGHFYARFAWDGSSSRGLFICEEKSISDGTG